MKSGGALCKVFVVASGGLRTRCIEIGCLPVPVVHGTKVATALGPRPAGYLFYWVSAVEKASGTAARGTDDGYLALCGGAQRIAVFHPPRADLAVVPCYGEPASFA